MNHAPTPRPLSMRLRLLLPLLALLAVPALAAPTLEGADFGEHVGGPRLSPRKLRGRVVVFVDWDKDHPETALSITDLLDTATPEALALVVNQCRQGTPKETFAAWTAATTQKKPLTLIHRGHLGGGDITDPAKAPKVAVFNGLGLLVHEGTPDAKCAEAIATALRLTTGVSAGKAAAQVRTQALFGDQIHATLLPVATALADPARPSATSLKMLANAAANKKDPILGAQAQALIDAFGKALPERLAAAEKLAESDPPRGHALMAELANWAPQKPEGAKAKAQVAAWKDDKAMQAELAADKLWQALEAQGDKLDYEKNPKSKPTPALTEAYAALLKKYPATCAARKAKEAAKEWRLDPETGKFAPPADQAKP